MFPHGNVAEIRSHFQVYCLNCLLVKSNNFSDGLMKSCFQLHMNDLHHNVNGDCMFDTVI